MSSSFDPNHPGILMGNKVLESMNMDLQKARNHINELTASRQERLITGRDQLTKDAIKELRNCEVARTYLGLSDISNPMARHKLSNAQKGLSPTGTALMSVSFERILDSKDKPKRAAPSVKNGMVGTTVEIGKLGR